MIGRWAQRFATAIENPVAAYGAAVGAVATAAAIRAVAGLVMADPPNFMAFFPAVLFATLVAGASGGLIATAASALIVRLLWLPSAPLTQIVLFTVAAGATVAIATALRIAVRRGAEVEERFKVFQEQALDGFVILEPVIEDGAVVDFTWTYANGAADRLAPTGSKSLVGLRVREGFPGETGMEMYRRFANAYTMPEPDNLEVRRVINGIERYLRSSAVRVGDGLAVSFTDVSDQRQSETALRSGQSRVQAIMDALPQLIWSARPNGVWDYLSPQWVAYTGSSAETQMGDAWMDAIHPDDVEAVRAAWTQTVKGALPFDIEFRLRRHDGIWRWFNVRASAVREEDGEIRRWFGTATDITEIFESRQDLEARVAERTQALEASLEQRARAEAALAQAQRLETVGRLTGGVAHDFNNLLTVVIGGLDMILKDPNNTTRVVRLGEAALAAGRRGERLTRQLLAFSRRQELKLEVVDLSAMIEQVEPLVRRAVGEAVNLTVNHEAGTFSRLDPAQFEAALLNLVVNAADAIDGSTGDIDIATTRKTLAEGEVQGAKAGDYVCVSVADTGVGMSPEIAQRAFEPFFTTKEVGRGTGLGLAQVYGFISQVGGAVSIHSELGKGTTVCLYLPIAQRPTVAEAEDGPASDPAWASEARVLLVEDDAAVRAVTEGMLADLGCTVTAAGDGPTALARLQAGEQFDLLLSDIIMPGGMSGVELAEAASARDPELPIVLTTGYAGDRVEPEGLAWPVLRKPFRAEQLSAAVRDALGKVPA